MELAKVYALNLSATDRALVLSDNFLRLIAGVKTQPIGLAQRPIGLFNDQRAVFDPWVMDQSSA